MIPSDSLYLRVDGHVHLYPSVPPRSLLDAAGENFFGATGAPGQQEAAALLVLADPEGVKGFDRLARSVETQDDEEWTPGYRDAKSLTVKRKDGARIAIVRGQQLITSEGLEVLTLDDQIHRSQRPLFSTVDRVTATGGISMIPWGAGKWYGRRGRLLTDLIRASEHREDLLLSDNGGRPACWSRVPHFDAAAAAGLHVVAGTDPLPINGEERRTGSFGFCIRISNIPEEQIASAFCRELRNPAAIISFFGQPIPLRRFISNQMRLHGRRKKVMAGMRGNAL